MAVISVQDKLWDSFLQRAKRLRRKPESLAQTVLREFLQRLDDEELNEASCRAARRTGYREEDAVELVRQLRRERAKERADGRAQASAGRRS